MKIIIKTEAKEVADLVKLLQSQPGIIVTLNVPECNTDDLVEKYTHVREIYRASALGTS